MSLSSDAPRQHRPGPGLALSIGVMVLATIIGVSGLAIGLTKTIHRVTHFADGPHGTLPAHISAALTPATWQVYVDENEGNDTGEFFGPTTTASDVTVTAPNGTEIPVRDMPGDLTETEESGSHSYVAVARFDISSPGNYSIRVQSNSGDAGVPIVVGKSFGSDLSGLLKWFAMAGGGFILGLIGLAMLVTGIIRRRSLHRRIAYGGGYGGLSSPGPGTGGGYYPAGGVPVAPTQPVPQSAPGMPPPGWYDDPHVPGMQRYWDGTRWTDQTRNTS